MIPWSTAERGPSERVKVLGATAAATSNPVRSAWRVRAAVTTSVAAETPVADAGVCEVNEAASTGMSAPPSRVWWPQGRSVAAALTSSLGSDDYSLSSRSSDVGDRSAGDAGRMTRTVDVLEGNAFVVSDERGDIDGSPVEVHGLFDRDTRYLSRWVLTVGGQRLTTLSVDRTRYYSAQFFLAPGVASTYVNATLAVIRRRTVLDGFHEVITLVNHDTERVDLEVVLEAAADFADLFEVKDATVDAKPGRSYRRAESDQLVLGYERDTYRRETWIRADAGAAYDEEGLRFSVGLAPQESWTCQVDVMPVRHGETPQFPPASTWDDPEQRLGLRLLRESFPVLKSSWRPLERIYEQSLQDLAALRFDLPTSPGRYMPAAGLPWFMAAFGRDSLITSFQALPFVPSLAETALITLAQMQATGVDDFRDAEPGKILHELRFGELTAFEERPHSPYYGAADVTQLWLVLLDEYERWTGRDDVVHALEGPARAALRWIDEFGDRDGDGYVEYQTRNPETGLPNQCWRDSTESIQSADGTMATLPRATCELQGYVYDAKRRGPPPPPRGGGGPAAAGRAPGGGGGLQEGGEPRLFLVGN